MGLAHPKKVVCYEKYISPFFNYVRNHLFIIEINYEAVRSIIELHEEEIILISIYESVRIRLS